MKDLLNKYAILYKQSRIDRGLIDLNLDVVVAYAVADLINSYKHLSQKEIKACYQAEIDDLEESSRKRNAV